MSIEELMKGLMAEYLAELPSKITLIESHCSANNTEALREDFHKLKGTGKTYGLPEISELAGVIEQLTLHNPQAAIASKDLYLSLLHDICNARLEGKELTLSADERFLKLKAMR